MQCKEEEEEKKNYFTLFFFVNTWLGIKKKEEDYAIYKLYAYMWRENIAWILVKSSFRTSKLKSEEHSNSTFNPRNFGFWKLCNIDYYVFVKWIFLDESYYENKWYRDLASHRTKLYEFTVLFSVFFYTPCKFPFLSVVYLSVTHRSKKIGRWVKALHCVIKHSKHPKAF